MDTMIRVDTDIDYLTTALHDQLMAFEHGKVICGDNLKDMITFFKSNLGGEQGVNLQRMNDFRTRLHIALNKGLCENFTINYENFDGLYAIYSLFMGGILEHLSVGIINYINNNIDYIYQYYYVNQPDNIKSFLTQDIETFKFTANIDDRYIVALFFLSQIIYDVISKGQIWAYLDQSTKQKVEENMVSKNGITFDSLISNLFLNTQNLYSFIPKIHNIVNYNLLIQLKGAIIESLSLYKYSHTFSPT